jgi:signal transduction histidine kinase
VSLPALHGPRTRLHGADAPRALRAATAFAALAALGLAAGTAASVVPLGWALAALFVAVLLGAGLAAVTLAARETARLRRALAASVSHDLRTPLAQIRMFTEMLLMQRERSEQERTRWLEAIERESHRLSNVMDNLLLFIHGDEPDPFPARRGIDIGALAEDVAAEFSARAAAAQMRIVADPPAGLQVFGDPSAIRQILVNLLDNALRFGPAGQTVRLGLSADAQQVVLCVSDEGPGIPGRQRAAAWTAFVRLDPAQTPEGGAGLGLAVVRRVVELHGGTARIEDAPGGGALVRICLPRLTGTSATTSSATPSDVLPSTVAS